MKVDLLVVRRLTSEDLAALRSSFGSWKGAFDPDEFLSGLRLPLTRPEPRL